MPKISDLLKKIHVTAILSLTMALLFSGCASQNTAIKPTNSAEADVETVTVIDYAGREVSVPANVQRIGCLYAFSGHVTAMLGRGLQIVAVVEGLKRDKIMNQLVPNISKSAVPQKAGAINIEELIKAKPDIIFIRSETANQAGEVDKINKSKIPYIVIDYKNIEEQQYAIEVIGKAIGAGERARKYNEYYQRCLERVREKIDQIPLDKRVRIYHSVNEATRTDEKNTLPADWLQIAGAINVSLDEDLKLIEDKYFASLEQIFLWNPDMIIANEPKAVKYIQSNKQWSALGAVKNQKVFQMPIGISRWGHPGSLETPLAVLWTAKTLYPESFQDINMNEEVKNYYREFFDLSLTNDEIIQILNGKGMRAPK
ncbi:ABC transporter substrate-binding protein [Petroclostridium sp. X23]|uniref:ABC transporter substrate-binding protein n=1 Tax=Petroclostridium sp. X23 TaxID=3045146 RepID=UPI0024ACAA65|nr:ABC transporter substrate-binding protein [Petroclostridium sp. X23]WHH58820.1 ABC transporter substrate-binding protein [Petroclostridium sp. X23]